MLKTPKALEKLEFCATQQPVLSPGQDLAQTRQGVTASAGIGSDGAPRAKSMPFKQIS